MHGSKNAFIEGKKTITVQSFMSYLKKWKSQSWRRTLSRKVVFKQQQVQNDSVIKKLKIKKKINIRVYVGI